MKTRSWLLTLVAAITGLAILAIPAQAGGKKKYYYGDGWQREGIINPIIGAVTTIRRLTTGQFTGGLQGSLFNSDSSNNRSVKG